MRFVTDIVSSRIDSLPPPGGRVIQNVPRLCKLIFPRQIASSTFSIEPEIGELITQLSAALRRDQQIPPAEKLREDTAGLLEEL